MSAFRIMKSSSTQMVTDGNIGTKVQRQKSFRIIDKKPDQLQDISAFSNNGGETFDVRQVRQYINKNGRHRVNAGVYKLTKDQVLHMLQKKNNMKNEENSAKKSKKPKTVSSPKAKSVSSKKSTSSSTPLKKKTKGTKVVPLSSKKAKSASSPKKIKVVKPAKKRVDSSKSK